MSRAPCTCPPTPCAACQAYARTQPYTNGRPPGQVSSQLTAHHDALVARYLAGEAIRAIARSYGVTQPSISRYLRVRGLWQGALSRAPRHHQRRHAKEDAS